MMAIVFHFNHIEPFTINIADHINMIHFLLLRCLFLLLPTLTSGLYEDDPWDSPIDVQDIRNDAVTISWNVPLEIANQTSWQRVMINVVRSSLPTSKSISVKVANSTRQYTFTNLLGNTTYRVSVEAFEEDISLWYDSLMATTSLASLDWMPAPHDITLLGKTNSTLDIWWQSPNIQETGHNVVINQHLVNVYEYNPTTKTTFKKYSINVPVPKTSVSINKLQPGTVYNITIQAGTSHGYGNMVWSSFSTLDQNQEEVILKLTQRTPNSLILTWPVKWLPKETSRFTIKAKTIHSPANVDKEIMMAGVGELGRSNEFVLRNLHPGSTYNVSILTIDNEPLKKGIKLMGPRRKFSWSVFSTLTQGEYTVGEPRIVVETETAVSIVFQPLKQLGEVLYQIRYTASDGSHAVEVPPQREFELVCPKFGCEWMCSLIFNLHRRPRDFTFDIRVKVDGVWNKWISIVRRPWNLLERVCSINPPSAPVANVGNPDFQREIEISSAKSPIIGDTWRYLVVVDSRQNDYSTLDIAKLADRATADIDRIPYYVAGSLSTEEVESNVAFRLGDGQVHGGYLNYPLRDRDVDPRWTLVSLSQVENEIMEPRLKTCGFTEDGNFDCQMSVVDLLSYIPLWATAFLTIVCVLVIFCCCLSLTYLGRRICERRNETKESSIMYYHNESPNTTATTREYRRIERREFKPSDFEERMRFMRDE